MLNGDFSYGFLIIYILIFYGVKNYRCINFKGLVKKNYLFENYFYIFC